MKLIGELSLMPVWVNPSHRVASAKVLLAGHKIRALGVVEGGVLIGTVGFEELASASDSDEVSAFVRPLSLTASLTDDTRYVAELMSREAADYLPIVEHGRLAGIVTATMLLREMGRSWDPLTGLNWSDAMRDWGIERLKEGRELTILFIDLDDFGQYNKRFGHIVGDRVLVKVAHYLKGAVDASIDSLCRYGGDEYAIATVRSRHETEELQKVLERGIQGTLVADSDQPVTFSAGIFGGRRTKERENVHYSATMDTLINMASKAAMAAKSAKKEPEPLPTAAKVEVGEISVVEVFSSGDSATSQTTVILSGDGRVASGVHTRGDSTKSQSAVLAGAKALERLIDGLQFELQDVQLSEDAAGGRFVTVSGSGGCGEARMAMAATRKVESDLYRTAVDALIEAVTAGA